MAGDDILKLLVMKYSLLSHDGNFLVVAMNQRIGAFAAFSKVGTQGMRVV
jgi:hypothetical protein